MATQKVEGSKGKFELSTSQGLALFGFVGVALILGSFALEFFLQGVSPGSAFGAMAYAYLPNGLLMAGEIFVSTCFLSFLIEKHSVGKSHKRIKQDMEGLRGEMARDFLSTRQAIEGLEHAIREDFIARYDL